MNFSTIFLVILGCLVIISSTANGRFAAIREKKEFQRRRYPVLRPERTDDNPWREVESTTKLRENEKVINEWEEPRIWERRKKERVPDRQALPVTVCAKKIFSCSTRIVGTVCGFEESTNGFKVYTSYCAMYTLACTKDLEIKPVDMKVCKQYTDLVGSQDPSGKSKSPPQRAFIHPENVVVEEGSDVTLLCLAIGGNPRPEFSWNIIPRRKSGRAGNTKGTTSSMTFKKINRAMAGTYQCSAYNTEGSVSASTTVTVKYGSKVSVSPTYRNIKKGQSAEFRCTASGNPPPKLVWKKGNIFKSASSTLYVRNAQLSDHGSYRCVASNSISTVTAEARLNVRVDGGWNSQSSWSCTQCGKNPYNNHKCQKKCERECNNPAPKNGGATCSGDIYISVDCSNDQCSTPNKKKDCFPGDVVVTLSNGGAKFMRDLQIGDNVLAVMSDNRVVSSKVLTFLHRDEKSQRIYKDIQTDHNTISLSAKHLIFVSEDGLIKNLQARYASEVKQGMFVSEEKSGVIRLAPVRKISNSTRMGLYNPLTEHGTIVVNHVISSCYASINSHYWAHIGLTPLRWYYMIGGLSEKDIPVRDIHWYPTLLESLIPVLPQSLF